MSKSPQTAACQAVDELAANGAVFHYRPATGVLPPSFTYELVGAGDRRRCRTIIVNSKADTAIWAAVLREVALRCDERASA